MNKSKATEALRVATNIAAIRAALDKRGYRLRKQPKQPVWKVIITPDHFYKLTYQPAPISASTKFYYFPVAWCVMLSLTHPTSDRSMTDR